MRISREYRKLQASKTSYGSTFVHNLYQSDDLHIKNIKTFLPRVFRETYGVRINCEDGSDSPYLRSRSDFVKKEYDKGLGYVYKKLLDVNRIVIDKYPDLFSSVEQMEIELDEYAGSRVLRVCQNYDQSVSLKDYLENIPMNDGGFKFVKTAIECFKMMAEIIRKMHSHNLLIIDVKPENFVINTVSKEIKLIDYEGIMESWSESWPTPDLFTATCQYACGDTLTRAEALEYVRSIVCGSTEKYESVRIKEFKTYLNSIEEHAVIPFDDLLTQFKRILTKSEDWYALGRCIEEYVLSNPKIDWHVIPYGSSIFDSYAPDLIHRLSFMLKNYGKSFGKESDKFMDIYVDSMKNFTVFEKTLKRYPDIRQNPGLSSVFFFIDDYLNDEARLVSCFDAIRLSYSTYDLYLNPLVLDMNPICDDCDAISRLEDIFDILDEEEYKYRNFAFIYPEFLGERGSASLSIDYINRCYLEMSGTKENPRYEQRYMFSIFINYNNDSGMTGVLRSFPLDLIDGLKYGNLDVLETAISRFQKKETNTCGKGILTVLGYDPNGSPMDDIVISYLNSIHTDVLLVCDDIPDELHENSVVLSENFDDVDSYLKPRLTVRRYSDSDNVLIEKAIIERTINTSLTFDELELWHNSLINAKRLNEEDREFISKVFILYQKMTHLFPEKKYWMNRKLEMIRIMHKFGLFHR